MSRDARGRFLPGPDPQRHRLTRRECKRGYRAALAKVQAAAGAWDGMAWLYYRVRGRYREARRAN